ncbi:MAG: hypothetical protein ACRCZF_17240, partial [Gemmataceae bacterium]
YWEYHGRWKKAIELAEPIIRGTKCTQSILSRGVSGRLESLVRLNRHEDAIVLLRRALPTCLKPPRYSAVFFSFAMLLALTENMNEAAKFLDKAQHELFQNGEELDYDRMTDFPFMALILRLLARTKKTVPIKQPERFGLEPTQKKIAPLVLAELLQSESKRLADLFAARNGNDFWPKRVRNIAGLTRFARPVPFHDG